MWLERDSGKWATGDLRIMVKGLWHVGGGEGGVNVYINFIHVYTI